MLRFLEIDNEPEKIWKYISKNESANSHDFTLYLRKIDFKSEEIVSIFTYFDLLERDEV